jgi:hypothetical protein
MCNNKPTKLNIFFGDFKWSECHLGQKLVKLAERNVNAFFCMDVRSTFHRSSEADVIKSSDEYNEKTPASC